MTKHVEYFGGKTHGHIILENGEREDVWFDRELWFDRDFNGRWLVGVVSHPAWGEESTGAILVNDPAISAFIELLRQLVVDPARFADEQMVIQPAWKGQLPER